MLPPAFDLLAPKRKIFCSTCASGAVAETRRLTKNRGLEHLDLGLHEARAVAETRHLGEDRGLEHLDLGLGQPLEHVAVRACGRLEKPRPRSLPGVRHAHSHLARIDAQREMGLIDRLEHLDQQGHLAAGERGKPIHPQPGPFDEIGLGDGPARTGDLGIRVDEFVSQRLVVLAKDQADIGEFQGRKAVGELRCCGLVG